MLLSHNNLLKGATRVEYLRILWPYHLAMHLHYLRALVTLACITGGLLLSAQPTLNYITDVATMGMGGAGSGAADHYTYLNPAQLATTSAISFGAQGGRRYDIPDLAEVAAYGAFRVGTGRGGVHVRRFGNDLYAETNASLGYGLRLSEKFSLGATADYYNRTMDMEEGDDALTFTVGMLLTVNERLQFGTSVFSPAPVDFGEEEQLSTQVRVGGLYRATPQVQLRADVVQSAETGITLSAGIGYRPVTRLELRVGTDTAYQGFTFGLGYQLDALGLRGSLPTLDIGAALHPQLGWTTAFGISWAMDWSQRRSF